MRRSFSYPPASVNFYLDSLTLECLTSQRGIRFGASRPGRRLAFDMGATASSKTFVNVVAPEFQKERNWLDSLDCRWRDIARHAPSYSRVGGSQLDAIT